MALGNKLATLLLVAKLCSIADGFHVRYRSYVCKQKKFPSRDASVHTSARPCASLLMAKGFDKNVQTSNKKPSNAPQEVTSVQSEISRIASGDDQEESTMNAGQKALERLRTKQREDKEAELRRVKELRSVDEYVRDDPTAAVIPEKVAMRMGQRMLPFVGIPLFGTMGAFVAFWYLRVYKNLEFSTVSVAVVTIGLLVVGLLGITYSVMSASWDSDREGSALGFEEFSSNLDNIKDGLKRSKENTLIREQMAGMPEAEIQAAIKSLDEKDKRAAKKKMSFEEKLDS